MADHLTSGYHYLLDATVQHLQELKSQGVQYVSINKGLLRDLQDPALIKPLSTAQNRPAETVSNARPQDHTPPSPPTPSSSNSDTIPSISKAQAMSELQSRAQACTKCPHLVQSRHNVVFGVGNVNASIMFVGEAPGAEEDQQGEPFVGRAGELLTKIIQTMGLSRDIVYIANILKCRPDTPEQRAGNRKPTADEMKTCIPFLHAQIDLIKPRVLIALGATALEGLLGPVGGITKMRGQWNSFRGIPLMPTYHPAYLLRIQSMAEKRKVWEDMLQVMEKTGLEISPKQKGFFLSAPSRH